MKKKRMVWDGREVQATEHLFRAAGEFWNEYLVDDGSVLRLKIVITEVNRLEGEYYDDGQPVYAIKSVNAMRVSAPKHLRRGEAGSWPRSPADLKLRVVRRVAQRYSDKSWRRSVE